MEDLDLSGFFKTQAQSVDFFTRLSTISEKIYKTGFNLEKVLTDQLGIQKKDKFMILLRDNKVSLSSNAALKDFISQVQEKISSLPTVSLTLAFEPKEDTLKSLSNWFPANINKQVLLDIKVDPEIIAGAYVSYKGKCSDFSIKPVFDQICKDGII
jgi:F0F1-type ATP synthase delta subunit